MVTRGDLHPGYQIAQAGHAISQFILENHNLAKHWNNNYLISLSASSEQKLQILLSKLHDTGIPVSHFIEPDIGNELTSICFLETKDTRKFTSSLPLSLINRN